VPDFDLGKKVGPLPLGGWVLVVGAGLTVGFLVNRNAGKKDDNAPVQLTESGVGTGGGTFLPIPPPTSEPIDAPEETNITWGIKALRWLIGRGFDPGIADNAIRKYLYGENLSLQEQMMLNMVLVEFGPPPEPLPPVDVPSVPPPTPPTPTPRAPDPVGNLRVTGSTNTTLSIAWDASPGATSYRIRAPFDGGHSVVPGTAFTRINLSPGKQYTLTVAAVNGTGDSEAKSVFGTTSGTASTPAPAPAPAPAPVRRHTISSGQTLWGISSQWYGTGTRWLEIYNANVGTIEAAARAHNRRSSRGPNGTVGWYIYPGTVLVIP